MPQLTRSDRSAETASGECLLIAAPSSPTDMVNERQQPHCEPAKALISLLRTIQFTVAYLLKPHIARDGSQAEAALLVAQSTVKSQKRQVADLLLLSLSCGNTTGLRTSGTCNLFFAILRTKCTNQNLCTRPRSCNFKPLKRLSDSLSPCATSPVYWI